MLRLRDHFQAALAAALNGARLVVDVILHLGAHRTGTTTLQVYLEQNRDNLKQIDTAFWGPNRTRSGLFSGLIKRPRDLTHDGVLRGERSCGLIRMELDRMEHAGVKTLIVSEENMIGSMANNLSETALYPDAGPRLSRFRGAFQGHCSRVALSIRSYDKYWISALSYMVERGWPLPDHAMLDRLVTQSRRWRDLIRDAAAAFPDAQLWVWPFEAMIGQPQTQLAVISGAPAPMRMRGGADWHNASARSDKLRQVLIERGQPEQAAALPVQNRRWQPFSAAHLDHQYQQDIAWLRQGADGIARYIEQKDDMAAGAHLRRSPNQRGQCNDPEERSVG